MGAAAAGNARTSPGLPRALFPQPIIQAPMAGLTHAGFVASCCEAGLLGSLGAGGLEPEALLDEIASIRRGTDRPFNVNLFVVDEASDVEIPAPELDALAEYCRANDLPLHEPTRFAPVFRDQFAALLEAAPPIASFTFGLLDRQRMAALHGRGIFVIGTATSAAELDAWQGEGADAVCLQGIEAGGHRGTFLSPDRRAGLRALLADCVALARVPLIAAGGIMNGADIVAMQRGGAAAVQMGTAFLCCDEAPTPAAYRSRLSDGLSAADTVLTRAFSGRWARGIRNGFIRQFEDEAVSPYPIRNALTQPLRKAATLRGDPEHMSLWAGTGLGGIRPGPVRVLAETLRAEIDAAADQANG